MSRTLTKVSGIASVGMTLYDPPPDRKPDVMLSIGERPAKLLMEHDWGHEPISSGDHVTAVGVDEPELQVIVLRNDTRHTIHSATTAVRSAIGGWWFVTLSIPLLLLPFNSQPVHTPLRIAPVVSVLFGLVMLLLGWSRLKHNRLYRRAVALLDSAA